MRGLGDYEKAQMKRADPRINQLFHHLRQAVDILEQVMLDPHSLPIPDRAPPPKPVNRPQPSNFDPTKLAYTVKEVRKLIGISHSRLYQAMQNRELRAVKCGHRTLIMAKDLQAWIDGWPERG